MQNLTKNRFLAALLALVMVISMLPVSVFAADSAGSYTQVTDLADITAGGQFVLVAKNGETYKALNTTISGKITAVDVTVADGVVASTSLPVWTIAATSDGVSLSTGSSYLSYNSSTNFKSDSVAYTWAVTAGSNGFAFINSTSNRGIFYQIDGNRFGAYAESNATNSNYVAELLVFKYTEGTGGGSNPDPDPSEPSVVSIATALAGAADTEFTVKGVVTLVDGKNLYLQDATGAICLRVSNATGVSLGDTLIGTGTRADYYGLPQLGSGTFEKSSGLTLASKETTLSALTTADICTYVKIAGLEVTEVYDNNGAWANPNITVKDSSGNTIQIYKAVADGVKVGDTLTVLAAVGVNNTTLQLRNTLATEITVTTSGNPDPGPTDPDVVPISTALAGADGAEFTVKGVVTLIDGKNVYVQDETGGICLYLSSTPSDIALGDTVIGTGSRGAYRGTPQLSSATFEKSSGLTLSAKDTTISALTTADLCTYVKITGLEVTEVYDNNGTWANPNITVKDSSGNTIQIYKAVADGVKVGDTVTVLAAVGANNETLQLRNTLATEVTVTAAGEPEPEPEETETAELVTSLDELAEGDEIIIVAAEYDFALSTNQKSNNRGDIAITKSDDGKEVTFGEEAQVITLEAGTIANTYAFFVGEGYLFAASSNSNWLRTETEKSDNSAWTISIDETTGVATIKSNGSNERNWLRYNTSSNLFACYASNNTTQKDIKIYKIPVEDNDPITEDMIGEGVLDLKEANAAAATGVTVIGQVVYHYGNAYNGAASINSIILEDVIDGEIVGFQIYDYTNYANYKVGDIVKVTGDIKAYNGVMQMSFPTMEVVKTGVEPIPAQTITVSQLGADYLSEYIYIQDITLGEYNASGYTTVTDTTGTINIYKGVPLDADITVADVIGVYGCCSAYNTTYQLRNGSSDDYVTENSAPPAADGMPAAGDVVVIYNLDAKGVLSLQDDNVESPSLTSAAATIADGKATAENGALLFTVETNGSYYRFVNETYGYLCSNGTGNNAFYQATASDDADWTLAVQGTGFTMESRTAKYNGKYSQYLEYYAGAYKTYSMYNVTDYDIYTFQFYPCVNTNVTAGVVNAPAVEFGAMADASLGIDYSFSFTVDAPFGVKEVKALCGNTELEVTTTADGYSVTVPADVVTGTELLIGVVGKDNKDVSFSNRTTVAVLDEPVLTDMTPASGSQTLDEKKPTISVKVANAGDEPTFSMKLGEEEVTATYENGVISYTPAEDMEDGRVTVTVTVTRADGKSATKTWGFTVGKAQYQLYFGQLHSHTTYSDGSGSLDSALEYIAGLPESANVDFVAFTDHSNYFDKSGAANPEGALYDMSLATEYSQTTWSTYKTTIDEFNQSQTDVIAIGGFEMTWSGGPGHINTFNTPGIVSRNNATLNNKTADAGMKAYYALLSRTEGADSISQFNHPGSTFGTFTDFAYWDAVVDSRIYLVEVGNGEGQIGQGGYYPSYEYYTMALDKGWHVGPTNNQDNHKGKWGNGNDARDVVLTDNFTEEGIYEAIRNYRIYATEDKNLEIYYSVNGYMMGSMFSEAPEKLNINVTVADPDASDSISKVEVIVNSGKVAYTWSDPAVLATGNLTCELDPNYSYYYIRVTQGDGDLAVTAPVWVGETLKLGISAVECDTSTPVTDEELTINTTLFNSESASAAVKALTYSIKGGEVIGTDTTGYTIPASGTLAIPFKYTPTDARIMTITVTAVVEADGQEYTFTMDVTLDVQNADNLVYIGIDASHYNEYVAGNYKDSMGNFGALAAEYSVRTVDLKTSDELIAACSNPKYKAIILTAPSRRLPAAQEALLTYTAEEIAAIKAFNENGGMVILAGWSDHYENYPDVASIAGMTADQHMAATQNAVLEALGSSLRIGDDATYDDSHNGGQAYRLYFNSYNFDSFLVEGVEVDEENPHDRLYTEVFSYYGGATVYTVGGTLPATVTPVVFGHSETYSVDVDKDGIGGASAPKYTYAEGDDRLMVLATEQLSGKGLIVVSGAAFMSNFEVQATIEDSGSEKNYANYKVCENLLKAINPVKISPIADVQAQEGEGYKFTIEGVVTSNASGYDKDTAFFDCIYLQDETAGINAFPVAGNFKIGDLVRITGTTSSYNGERQIAVTSIELIGDGTPVEPTEITAEQLNDGSMLGSLVTLNGTVKSFELANGLVQTIMVEDADGNVGRVFIDGYITTAEDVKDLEVGCEITVTGLASYDNSFDGVAPRIRVRDRADVVCTPVPTYTITVSDVTGGSVEADKDAAKAGETVTITVTADDGKVIDTVTVIDIDEIDVDVVDNGDGTYTFEQPANDVTVTVTFKDKEAADPVDEHEITVKPSDSGKTTVSDETPKTGDTVTITAAPDEGVEVEKVVVKGADGKEITVTKNSDGTYSYVQPDGDVAIEVTYKPNYKITKGDGSSTLKTSGNDLSFTANGAFAKFTGIEVDGKAVDAANYTAKAGSTIITLKGSYLKTLSTGKHTITVIYTDGEAEGTFYVTLTADGTTPPTGDNSQIVLWIGLMAVSALAVLLLVNSKRRFAK